MSGRRTQRGFTLVELLVSIAIMGVLATMMLPALSRAVESAKRAVCANNLRQVGMALMMYADEDDGLFPPIQEVDTPQCLAGPLPPLMIRGRAMYPEYLTDARVLICPSSLYAKEQYDEGRWWETNLVGRPGERPIVSPCRIDDLSYHYVPWMVRPEWIMDDATMDFSRDFYVGFLDAVETAGHSPRGADEWTFVDENGRDQRVHPLRHGVERTLITDIDAPWRGWQSDSSIPIAFDHVSTNRVYFNHLPGGANVLYMDGHVEFATYPRMEPYPLTRAWAMMVADLDSEQVMDGGDTLLSR